MTAQARSMPRRIQHHAGLELGLYQGCWDPTLGKDSAYAERRGFTVWAGLGQVNGARLGPPKNVLAPTGFEIDAGVGKGCKKVSREKSGLRSGFKPCSTDVITVRILQYTRHLIELYGCPRCRH